MRFVPLASPSQPQVVKRIVQSGIGPRRPRQDDLVQCFYNGRVETDLLDDDEYTLAQVGETGRRGDGETGRRGDGGNENACG